MGKHNTLILYICSKDFNHRQCKCSDYYECTHFYKACECADSDICMCESQLNDNIIYENNITADPSVVTPCCYIASDTVTGFDDCGCYNDREYLQICRNALDALANGERDALESINELTTILDQFSELAKNELLDKQKHKIVLKVWYG